MAPYRIFPLCTLPSKTIEQYIGKVGKKLFLALGLKIYSLSTAFAQGFEFGNALQLVFAVLLLALGVVVVAIMGIKKLVSPVKETAKTEEAPAEEAK